MFGQKHVFCIVRSVKELGWDLLSSSNWGKKWVHDGLKVDMLASYLAIQ